MGSMGIKAADKITDTLFWREGFFITLSFVNFFSHCSVFYVYTFSLLNMQSN